MANAVRTGVSTVECRMRDDDDDEDDDDNDGGSSFEMRRSSFDIADIKRRERVKRDISRRFA